MPKETLSRKTLSNYQTYETECLFQTRYSTVSRFPLTARRAL